MASKKRGEGSSNGLPMAEAEEAGDVILLMSRGAGLIGRREWFASLDFEAVATLGEIATLEWKMPLFEAGDGEGRSVLGVALIVDAMRGETGIFERALPTFDEIEGEDI